jgi:hypothetical protein
MHDSCRKALFQLLLSHAAGGREALKQTASLNETASPLAVFLFEPQRAQSPQHGA